MTTFDKNGRMTSCFHPPSDPAVWYPHHACAIFLGLFNYAGLGHCYRHPGDFSKEEWRALVEYAREHAVSAEQIQERYVWGKYAGDFGYHMNGKKWAKEDHEPASPAYQIYKELNPKWHAFVEGRGPVPGLDER